MQQKGRLVCVGQIAGARGLNGEFFVRSFTDDPQAIERYGPLSTELGDRSLKVHVVGVTKNGLVVRAEGIDDRSGAEALRGLRLYVSREVLPAPDDDEFYHADLIGLVTQIAADGEPSVAPFGRVAAVHDFGAGPILEIERAGAPPLMIPFTRAAVPTVDIEGGRIVIAFLPGLFEDAPVPDPGEQQP